MGMMTRDAFVDPRSARRLLRSGEGESSGPVSGRFGHFLVRVVSIEEGQVAAFRWT